MRRSSILAIVGLAVGVLVSFAGPAPAAAADPTFGSISATATFGKSVDLGETVTLPDGVVRIEAILDFGASTRSFAAEVTVPAGASQTLHYSYPSPLGELLPNTRVTGHFRVTLADGTPVDGPSASVLYSDTRFDWKTLSGGVVRVHWTVGDDAFGRRALKIGQDAVTRISALLGVTETEPIDFFIYADRNAFYDILGPSSRESVGGVAFSEIRTLFANIDAATIDSSWVGVVIPHELTHLVADTATKNPYHGMPHWMSEGLAVYLSEGYTASDRSQVRAAVDDGSLMPLGALSGQFPTTPDRFSLAYAESVSAIDLMVRGHGQDGLIALVRSYATGVTDDEAFRAALGTDVAGFEAAWLQDLGAPTPKAYGPQAPPEGPVPSGWEGAAPTPGDVVVPGSPAPSPSTSGGGGSPSGPALVAAIGIGALFLVMLVVYLRGRARRTVAPPTAR